MPPNPKSKTSKTAKTKPGPKPNRPRPVDTRFELALLVGRAIALESFHQSFKDDPEAAADTLDGIKLSKNDLEAIAEIKWDQVDPLIQQLRTLLPPPSRPIPLKDNAGW